MLPLVGRTAQSLAAWLAPDATALRLVPDLDRIDALSDEREALWRRIGAADFLTDDEKREAVGYGPRGVGASPGGTKYSPDQLRVPAGSSDGGQWTSGGGGGVRVAQLGGATLSDALPAGAESLVELVGDRGRNEFTGYAVPAVRLDEEDALGYGAHTIAKHVGRTDRGLIEYLKPRVIWGPLLNRYQEAEVSFDDQTSANDVVNRALKKVPEIVARVASGVVEEETVNVRLGSRTGREAFRSSEFMTPTIRQSFGVRVVIRHRPHVAKGFQVFTAFPINHSKAGWDWNSHD